METIYAITERPVDRPHEDEVGGGFRDVVFLSFAFIESEISTWKFALEFHYSALYLICILWRNKDRFMQMFSLSVRVFCLVKK